NGRRQGLALPDPLPARRHQARGPGTARVVRPLDAIAEAHKVSSDPQLPRQEALARQDRPLWQAREIALDVEHPGRTEEDGACREVRAGAADTALAVGCRGHDPVSAQACVRPRLIGSPGPAAVSSSAPSDPATGRRSGPLTSRDPPAMVAGPERSHDTAPHPIRAA